MAQRIVSATRTIAAPAEKIFEVLADPSQHPVIDGSGSVTASKDNPARLSMPYVTKNTVSEFDEGRIIAWHHFAQFVWRYELVPVEGGTEVTESFDYSKPWGIALGPLGFPAKNQAAMIKTLERLDHLVTTGSPG